MPNAAVPDPGHAHYPKSGDRQRLQGNDAIRFAVRVHLEIPVPAQDGDDAPLRLSMSVKAASAGDQEAVGVLVDSGMELVVRKGTS